MAKAVASFKRWWNAHFSGFTTQERWGYWVWLIFSAIVLVPEFWAAFWKDSAPFPTISATTGNLEYEWPILSLAVVGVIVLCIYSGVRYPVTRTGVLATKDPSPVDPETHYGEDALVPYRTPGGGRITRSVTPVREIAATAYFIAAALTILVLTGIAIATTGGLDEFAVGETLYGSIVVFWIVLPSAMAWPKRFAVDVPFPTLFSTVRSLERRIRPLALLVAVGMVILLLHLALYPWPSIIPDIQRTHRAYDCDPLPPKAPKGDDCDRLDKALIKPEPNDP
jgi:hypothetical protein